MAESNLNAGECTQGPESVPIDVFSWFHGDKTISSSEDFIATAKDIAAGAATVMQMLEAAELCRDNNEEMLSKFQMGNLTRFCISSLWLLENEASQQIDRIMKGRGNHHGQQ